MEQSITKRRHIKLRRWGITPKKAYNTQNMAEVWNQAYMWISRLHCHSFLYEFSGSIYRAVMYEMIIYVLRQLIYLLHAAESFFRR